MNREEFEEMIYQMLKGVCLACELSEANLKSKAKIRASILWESVRADDTAELWQRVFREYARDAERLPRPADLLAIRERLRPGGVAPQKPAAPAARRDIRAIHYGEHLLECWRRRMPLSEARQSYEPPASWSEYARKINGGEHE